MGANTAELLGAFLEALKQAVDDKPKGSMHDPKHRGEDWKLTSREAHSRVRDGVACSTIGKQSTFYTQQFEVGEHKSQCQQCFRPKIAMNLLQCSECSHKVCDDCRGVRHEHKTFGMSLGGNFHQIDFRMECDIRGLIAFGVLPPDCTDGEGVGNPSDSHGFYFRGGERVVFMRGKEVQGAGPSLSLRKGDRVVLILYMSKLACFWRGANGEVKKVGVMTDVEKDYRFGVTVTNSSQKVSVGPALRPVFSGLPIIVGESSQWLQAQCELRNIGGDKIKMLTGLHACISHVDDRDGTVAIFLPKESGLSCPKVVWIPQNCVSIDSCGKRAKLDHELRVGTQVMRHPGRWCWGNQDGGFGSVGKVVEVRSDGQVEVRWPNGKKANYRNGQQGCYDLMLPILPGSRVKRNPFHWWKWDNQDEGGEGQVLGKSDEPGWVRVKWDSGETNSYRVSAEAVDIQVVTNSGKNSGGRGTFEHQGSMKPDPKSRGENWVLKATDSDCVLSDGVAGAKPATQATFYTQKFRTECHSTVTCDQCFRSGFYMNRYKCSVCDDYDQCDDCRGTPHQHDSFHLALGGNFHQIDFRMESNMNGLIAFGLLPDDCIRGKGVGSDGNSHAFYFPHGGKDTRKVRGKECIGGSETVKLCADDRVVLILNNSKLDCFWRSSNGSVKHLGEMRDIHGTFRFGVTMTESSQRVSVCSAGRPWYPGMAVVVTENTQWLKTQCKLRGIEQCDEARGAKVLVSHVDDGDNTLAVFLPGRSGVTWIPQNCVTSDAGAEPAKLDHKLRVGTEVMRHPGRWCWGDQDGGFGEVGKVVALRGDGQVEVRWPNGAKANYRNGQDSCYDLMLPIRTGVRVKRNPFHWWEWDDQDRHGEGVVISDSEKDGWVRVKWDHGSSEHYRLSPEAADVQVAVPRQQEQNNDIRRGNTNFQPASPSRIRDPVDRDSDLEESAATTATSSGATSSGSSDDDMRRHHIGREDFELGDKLLGQGQFGRVFKGMYGMIPVAVKVMPANSEEEARRELVTLNKLQYPHLAKAMAYHFDEKGRQIYVIMELLKGDVLSVIDRESSPCVPWSDFFKILCGAGHGLAHLHKHGFVHRDIKPGNIMLDSEGNAKLVDFGLAKEAGSCILRTGTMATACGTPVYTAPEVLCGGKTTEKVDVWSLGGVGKELITGEHPRYGASNTAEFFMRLAQPESFDKVRSVNGLPSGLDDVLEAMMRLDPDQRLSLRGETGALKRLKLIHATSP